jgi:membrane protein DedA with SNARE-associated domain
LFDWITQIVSDYGYPGIALLMLGENIFPPIPSELIMPLAGFVAAQGQLNPVLVVLAGTLGSVLGALPWYYAGKWLGEERVCALAARHGRWLTVDDKDVGKAIRWFERHGRMAVLIGRLIPTVRTLISVPAGMARMPLLPFLLFSSIGSLVWTAALAGAGYLLEANYRLVGDYLDQASKIIIGLIVLTYLWRLVSGGRLGARVRAWAAGLRRDVHAIYLASRDRRVPWYAKGLALLIAAYAVSPIDLIRIPCAAGLQCRHSLIRQARPTGGGDPWGRRVTLTAHLRLARIRRLATSSQFARSSSIEPPSFRAALATTRSSYSASGSPISFWRKSAWHLRQSIRAPARSGHPQDWLWQPSCSVDTGSGQRSFWVPGSPMRPPPARSTPRRRLRSATRSNASSAGI